MMYIKWFDVIILDFKFCHQMKKKIIASQKKMQAKTFP